jgi:dynein heavy chain
VNLPKFNSNDIPLFQSITTDLFPKIQIKNRDYEEFSKVIAETLKEEFKEPKIVIFKYLKELIKKCI